MKRRRLCFAVDLNNDPKAIESYKLHHRPGGPPAAVTRSLRAAGICELEIHLLGNRLFMIMEVDAEYSPDDEARADVGNADVQAWNVLMESMQQALPFATGDASSGKWCRMKCIYSLSEQP